MAQVSTQKLAPSNLAFSGPFSGMNQDAQSNAYGAQAQAQASMYGADQQLAGTKDTNKANITQTDMSTARNLQGQQYVADKNLAASNYGADAQKAASIYGADQSLAGTKYANDSATNQLNTKLNYATNRFNQIFPFLQNSYSGLLGVLSGNSGTSSGNSTSSPTPAQGASRSASPLVSTLSGDGTVAAPYSSSAAVPLQAADYGASAATPAQAADSSGTSGTGASTYLGPTIDTSPVYSQGMIDQQVNAGVAANDRTAAQQSRQYANDAAGRGISGGSPLLQYLQMGANANRLAQNATTRREIPYQAAKDNAQQLLQAQIANADQYTQRQREKIASQGNLVQANSALLQALTGLVGGI